MPRQRKLSAGWIAGYEEAKRQIADYIEAHRNDVHGEPGIPWLRHLAEEVRKLAPGRGEDLFATSTCGVVSIDYEAAFERFWKTFPKRYGANPKKRAKELYLSAVRRGKATVEALQFGAEREARQRAKENPRGTVMVSTWLYQERWDDEQWQPPEGGESIFDLERVS
jgi:hypothetical protein